MPIKARWELHGAYFAVSGIVPIGEVLGARKFMLNPPQGVNPEYQIIDLRKVERLDFDQMDEINIAMGDLAVAERYPNIKIAMLCTDPAVEQTVLDYFKSSWSAGTKGDFRLFRDLDATREWIGLPYPESQDDIISNGAGAANSLSLPEDR